MEVQLQNCSGQDWDPFKEQDAEHHPSLGLGHSVGSNLLKDVMSKVKQYNCDETYTWQCMTIFLNVNSYFTMK